MLVNWLAGGREALIFSICPVSVVQTFNEAAYLQNSFTVLSCKLYKPTPAHYCKPPSGVLNSHCVLRSVPCDIDTEAVSSKETCYFIDRPGAGSIDRVRLWRGSSIVVQSEKLSAGKMTRGHLRAGLEG